MDHVGELIFFMRGNKIANKEHVERTRRKMKESMIEQFQHRRKRSNNFTFDELLGYTNEGSDECVETQSPVSNYENIFSPMSLTADSPLPSNTTVPFNSLKRQTTEVNTPLATQDPLTSTTLSDPTLIPPLSLFCPWLVITVYGL